MKWDLKLGKRSLNRGCLPNSACKTLNRWFMHYLYCEKWDIHNMHIAQWLSSNQVMNPTQLGRSIRPLTCFSPTIDSGFSLPNLCKSKLIWIKIVDFMHSIHCQVHYFTLKFIYPFKIIDLFKLMLNKCYEYVCIYFKFEY